MSEISEEGRGIEPSFLEGEREEVGGRGESGLATALRQKSWEEEKEKWEKRDLSSPSLLTVEASLPRSLSSAQHVT